MNNTQNKKLIEDDKTYCHYLEPAQKYIWALVSNKKISLDHFRAIIFKIIKPAKWTNKRKFFVNTVNELETKKEIAYYISNSCRVAREFNL